MFDENKQMKVIPMELEILEYDNGMVILFEPEKQLWLRTSTTGLWIYKYIEENKCTFKELLQIICETNDLPVSEIENDIRYFINDLYMCGFIEVENEASYNKNSTIVKELNEFNLNELWIEIVPNENSIKASVEEKECGYFPIEKLEDILIGAKLLGVRFITISGKDPLLHPQFQQMLKKIRTVSDWKIKVRTTFESENWDNVDAIIEYVDIIQIVLDGVKEETHDKLVGKGNFKNVINLFKYLRENRDSQKTEIGILYTPVSENIEEMRLLLEIGYSNRLDFIHVNQVKLADFYLNMTETERKEFFKKIHDYFVRILSKNTFELIRVKPDDAKKIELNDNFTLYYDFLQTIKKHNCEAGITKLCVLENGDIFPCATLKSYPNALIGNVFTEDSLSDAYKKARNWNKSVFSVEKDEKCKICNFRYYCGGGCRARASLLNERDLMCDTIIEIYQNFFKYMENMDLNVGNVEEQNNERTKEQFFFRHCN